MDVKSWRTSLTTLLLTLFLSAIFPTSFSETDHVLNYNNPTPLTSVLFPIQGNVYPLGYYTVNISIGNPPKFYDLDIDTGSDVTWVQCDLPCIGCTIPLNQQYKPHRNQVECKDPLCDGVQLISNLQCADPNEQCDYDVEYADQGSTMGVLVRDNIQLELNNESLASPMLAFGCGYDQMHDGNSPLPSTAGVLGLGSGKTSIVSQLNSLGLIHNMVGHCLSAEGGGYLFFGDNDISHSVVDWTPILQSSSSSVKHYITGPAALHFNGMPTSVQSFELIFDSGSSYTYFNSQAYIALVDLVTNDLKGKPLTRATESEDSSLPICWKGPKPFTSLNDVANYFKPLALIFPNSMVSSATKLLPQFRLPPEAYLIVTTHGNVCLGILNGTEIELGNINIIGDISLQDKIVIYDNEKQQVGWTGQVNCNANEATALGPAGFYFVLLFLYVILKINLNLNHQRVHFIVLFMINFK